MCYYKDEVRQENVYCQEVTMEFEKVIAMRRSVRRYSDEPVSKEDIEKIIAAGERSPIGHFDFKGYAFAVVTDKKILSLLAKQNDELTGRGDPLYGAPLMILVMSTPEAREDSIKLNAGIMVENMHLEATDLGLGSICIFSFIRTLNQEEGYGKYFQAMNMPEGLKPAFALGVGHTPIPMRERRYVPRVAVFHRDGEE